MEGGNSTKIHLWILLLLPLTTFASKAVYRPTKSNGEGLSWINFLVVNGGFLDATVFKSINVGDVDNCAYECTANYSCISFNLLQKSEFTFECQLCNGDRFYNWKNFSYNVDGSDHYGIDSVCWRQKSTCKDTEICLPYYSNNSYQCIRNESMNDVNKGLSGALGNIIFRGSKEDTILVPLKIPQMTDPSGQLLIYAQFALGNGSNNNVFMTLGEETSCHNFKVTYYGSGREMSLNYYGKNAFTTVAPQVWNTLCIRLPGQSSTAVAQVWWNGIKLAAPSLHITFQSENLTLAIGGVTECITNENIIQFYGSITNLYIAAEDVQTQKGLGFQALMLLHEKFEDDLMETTTIFNLVKEVNALHLNDPSRYVNKPGLLSIGQKFYVSVDENKILTSSLKRSMESIHVAFYMKTNGVSCNESAEPIVRLVVTLEDGTSTSAPIVIALYDSGRIINVHLPEEVAKPRRLQFPVPSTLCNGTWHHVQIVLRISTKAVLAIIDTKEVFSTKNPVFENIDTLILQQIEIGHMSGSYYTDIADGTYFRGDLTMLQLTDNPNKDIFKGCGNRLYTDYMNFDWTIFSFDNLAEEDINPIGNISYIETCAYL